MTTIRQAVQEATELLRATSPSARLDAQVLLAHVLNTSRVFVLAEGKQHPAPEQIAAFHALLQRRVAGEPVAYLTQHKEFYGFDFYVDRRVLIPRPETELIVDLTLDWWARQPSSARPLTIADIGTGSGCLAIALALKLSHARVYAVDLSPDALEVARINVERHAVEQRVTLLLGEGCAPLPEPVTLIVSNPPYTIVDEVDENVRRWEPHLALDGGAEHGFAIPAHLLRQAPPYLQARGALLMEIGAWQGSLARHAAHTVFPNSRVVIHHDLAGRERVLAIQT